MSPSACKQREKAIQNNAPKPFCQSHMRTMSLPEGRRKQPRSSLEPAKDLPRTCEGLPPEERSQILKPAKSCKGLPRLPRTAKNLQKPKASEAIASMSELPRCALSALSHLSKETRVFHPISPWLRIITKAPIELHFLDQTMELCKQPYVCA